MQAQDPNVLEQLFSHTGKPHAQPCIYRTPQPCLAWVACKFLLYSMQHSTPLRSAPLVSFVSLVSLVPREKAAFPLTHLPSSLTNSLPKRKKRKKNPRLLYNTSRIGYAMLCYATLHHHHQRHQRHRHRLLYMPDYTTPPHDAVQ